MGTRKRIFVGGPNPEEVMEYLTLALAERVAALSPDPEHR